MTTAPAGTECFLHLETSCTRIECNETGSDHLASFLAIDTPSSQQCLFQEQLPCPSSVLVVLLCIRVYNGIDCVLVAIVRQEHETSFQRPSEEGWVCGWAGVLETALLFLPFHCSAQMYIVQMLYLQWAFLYRGDEKRKTQKINFPNPLNVSPLPRIDRTLEQNFSVLFLLCVSHDHGLVCPHSASVRGEIHPPIAVFEKLNTQQNDTPVSLEIPQ